MEQELRRRIEELERKVMSLEDERRERDRQQISFPLDTVSVTVIAKALQDAGYTIT